MIKLSVLKNRLSGILSVGYPSFSVVSGILSVGYPNISGCLGYIVGWTPEFFSCLGYIVSCGYPTRTHTHTRGNSVAHVWMEEKGGEKIELQLLLSIN
jgi:hypothetical protein